MKKLLLIRHAKSDWGNFQLADFDRPLNQRGERNALEMAQSLYDKGIIPQKIVASPAKRAITTARLIAENMGINPASIIENLAIYEAPYTAILNVINELDDKDDFIAIVGHNPGLTHLAIKLCNLDTADIPTCGVVLLSFPFDSWKMISSDTGEKILYDFPKSDEQND